MRRAPKRVQRPAVEPHQLARAFKGIASAQVRLALATIGYVRRKAE